MPEKVIPRNSILDNTIPKNENLFHLPNVPYIYFSINFPRTPASKLFMYNNGSFNNSYEPKPLLAQLWGTINHGYHFNVSTSKSIATFHFEGIFLQTQNNLPKDNICFFCHSPSTTPKKY